MRACVCVRARACVCVRARACVCVYLFDERVQVLGDLPAGVAPSLARRRVAARKAGHAAPRERLPHLRTRAHTHTRTPLKLNIDQVCLPGERVVNSAWGPLRTRTDDAADGSITVNYCDPLRYGRLWLGKTRRDSANVQHVVYSNRDTTVVSWTHVVRNRRLED